MSPQMKVKSLLGSLKYCGDWVALSPIARKVRSRELTYLTPSKLRNLERCAHAANETGVDGDFIECGVALGGSAIVLASQKGQRRSFHGYDIFGMIPAPSERDDQHAHDRYKVIQEGRSRGIGSSRYYGYIDDLYERVIANFREFDLDVDGAGITLHRGPFQETLKFEPEQRIALAHIDCDWHDSVWLCLDAIYERLSPGAFVVLDDYNDFGGCRTAADAFLAEKQDLHLWTTKANAVISREISHEAFVRS